MSKEMNKVLEGYLSVLESSLSKITVSERAEIITEIKSHVLDALEADEGKTIDQILESLGEPEQVANRYLLERGLTPQSAPRRSVIKWLVIGFLGMFALIVFSITMILWKFTPIIKVDEGQGKLQLFGGAIDIDEKEGRIKIGGALHLTEDSYDQKIEIESSYSPGMLKKLKIYFENGKMSFKNSSSELFKYKCKYNGDLIERNPEPKNGDLVLDFSSTKSSKCEFLIPEKIQLEVEGQNGKLEFKELRNNVFSKIENGKIRFRSDEHTVYKFENKVKNGTLNEREVELDSDQNPEFQIQIKVENGSLEVN